MNPYDIDYRNLKESTQITDEKELLKLRLIASFNKITSQMETDAILEATGLHKSDLSRLRTFGLDRFSIDRLITLLNSLGYTTVLNVKPKKVS